MYNCSVGADLKRGNQPFVKGPDRVYLVPAV